MAEQRSLGFHLVEVAATLLNTLGLIPVANERKVDWVRREANRLTASRSVGEKAATVACGLPLND
jgi:hypothetical protein